MFLNFKTLNLWVLLIMEGGRREEGGRRVEEGSEGGGESKFSNCPHISSFLIFYFPSLSLSVSFILTFSLYIYFSPYLFLSLLPSLYLSILLSVSYPLFLLPPFSLFIYSILSLFSLEYQFRGFLKKTSN